MRLKKPSGPRRTRQTSDWASADDGPASPGRGARPTWPSIGDEQVLGAGVDRLEVTMSHRPGTTSGRTARVCAQIGVTTIASTPGATIGPPADSE